MFRILLIVILIFYALYKLGLFRVFAGSINDGYRDGDQVNRKPPGGNVNVDKAPPKDKRNGEYKGGEYVDYEEVK